MDNAIRWAPKALKQASKLDRPTRTKIYTAVQELKEMPNTRNVKALERHKYGYRLRVGNYRVLFDWDGEIRIVDVQEVKIRNENTY
ncbi:type II toxin-antitoxin system RelE family toxin [Cupriavidus alkaliphilus]|uniref:type II toxin-antitoxin system RelE family toxin n=1 Tax=Cupriavidus alkaliphilus TaxID=942866 RepID=UPI0016205780|nr:type II toxin-antitoxin system RelE/ParE family toxin [Cupriavidus alkaliphilus]